MGKYQLSILRKYQQDLYDRAKIELANKRAICLQLVTGGGKTPIIAAMCESVTTKLKRAWVIVNRNELLSQTSEHLKNWNVNHSMIKPDTHESNAFRIHVVSKDTLIRRYDKIKNWPDLLIFDECHLYLDRQHEIISHLPVTSKIIGMTATPERMDGRGLSEVYESLIEGQSIPWMMDNNYLSDLKYFSPPIDGLQNIKTRGTEYDEEQLEELLQRKKIYGELVGHYEKYGKGKPALIFCRSVKSAYQTAERFRGKGFNFECIEGKMSGTKRKSLIDGLTNGEIDGLTNCEIATYGLDIPRVEYGASIRPTASRALYMQMIGRILRPYKNNETGYIKQSAMFFDHVNLILEHQDDKYPGVPLHYVPEITWNFYGIEKRKRNKNNTNIKLCPYLDFMYCTKPSCAGCEYNPDKNKTDVRKPMVVVPAELEEIKKPVKLKDRDPLEQKEIHDKISSLILDYNQGKHGPIEKMIDIADDLGYSMLWVYRQFVNVNTMAVQIPILSEIARIKGYKPGWVWIQKNKLRGVK